MPLTADQRPRKFICRVAAGDSAGALSGVWRIWAAKNQPELYIAIRSLGGHVKATVHCPRVGMATWKRHFGLVAGAKGDVAEDMRGTGESRHKVVWTGAKLGEYCTLEWRIFVMAAGLSKVPSPVSTDVTLVPPPAEGECLVFAVILGPTMETNGYPRAQGLDTHLAAEGRLSDGRRVWVTYCYAPSGTINVPPKSRLNMRRRVSAEELRAAVAEGHVRAFAVADNSDGSLGFFDTRVEQRQ